MRKAMWAAVGLLFLSILSSCEKQETEDVVVVRGYMGAARKNPYLAAERYLKESGREIESQSGVVKMDPEVGVVFAPASTLRSKGDVERVLSWVESGGHYVCLLARGEDFWKDVGESVDHNEHQWYEDDEQKNRALEEFAQRAGYQLKEMMGETWDETVSEMLDESKNKDARLAILRGETLPFAQRTMVEIDGQRYAMLLGGTQGVMAMDGGEKKARRFASTEHGLGRITFLSDARALRNPYLGMADHALVLDALANHPGKVVFSLGTVPSFLGLLGEHASKALMGLMVLLFLWLWKSLPNFGPKLEVDEAGLSSYREHLANTFTGNPCLFS